jgi:hypothetical protein
MPNDNAKADVDISVTDELDAADAAVISDGLRAHYPRRAAARAPARVHRSLSPRIASIRGYRHAGDLRGQRS